MAASSWDLSSLSTGLKTLASSFKSTKPPSMSLKELHVMEGLLIETMAYSKSLQNISTSYLNRLPPEILLVIFSFLRLDISARVPFPLPDDFSEWAWVTHVCRYWRQTALSTPLLWNRIQLSDNTPELALDWLRRSKYSPFRLYFTGSLLGESPDEMDSSMYNALLEISFEIPRLHELHVQTSWVRNSRFWDLMDRSAPMLESLSLEMNIDEAEDAVSVLPRIFDDDMPRLKNVYLSGVSAWPYNCFGNLVRLYLYDQPIDTRPDLITFLQILKATSITLEELVLVRAGPTHYDLEMGTRIYDAAPVIALPALRYIEVGDTDAQYWSGDHLKLLFSHIIIPPTAKSCFYENCHYLTLPEYFPQRAGDLSLPTIRKFALTSYRALETAHSCVVIHINSTLYANYRWDLPEFILQSDDADFLKGVDELIFASEGHNVPFDQIFAALPSLRVLKVTGSFVSKLDQLWDVLRECDGGGGTEIAFKYVNRLESIHVYPEKGPTLSQAQNILEGLVETAIIRRTNGRPLKEIVTDLFPEDELAQLEGVFEDVIFMDSSNGDETGVTRDGILQTFFEPHCRCKDSF
ncbi:hypothetical protein P691DRAFT_775430 [Macrolepiota fuliginosa MF-IS2]|uniref:F-box domain-containing protein n=1 Tax=Macrolepiota fuliginosa MF-IS2 TaxID=1400762 RepID=A0A9P5XD04_9AGAR|nr:hypothetical protein P691DRAFT_775430 [Macrolepiota fuliginosa MF-IS2]